MSKALTKPDSTTVKTAFSFLAAVEANVREPAEFAGLILSLLLLKKADDNEAEVPLIVLSFDIFDGVRPVASGFFLCTPLPDVTEADFEELKFVGADESFFDSKAVAAPGFEPECMRSFSLSLVFVLLMVIFIPSDDGLTIYSPDLPSILGTAGVAEPGVEGGVEEEVFISDVAIVPETAFLSRSFFRSF